MKSYTDLEQSKKLAEILPIESADMVYLRCDFEDEDEYSILVGSYHEGYAEREDGTIVPVFDEHIPAWSLAALLNVLPLNLIVNNHNYAFSMVKGLNKNGETYAIKYAIFNTTFYFHLTEFYNNPVDACVAMIEKLHERNLL
jgi:hypothetical protein